MSVYGAGIFSQTIFNGCVCHMLPINVSETVHFLYESDFSDQTCWNCFLDEPFGAKVTLFSLHFDTSKWGIFYVSRGCLALLNGNDKPHQNGAVCLEGLHFFLDVSYGPRTSYKWSYRPISRVITPVTHL